MSKSKYFKIGDWVIDGNYEVAQILDIEGKLVTLDNDSSTNIDLCEKWYPRNNEWVCNKKSVHINPESRDRFEVFRWSDSYNELPNLIANVEPFVGKLPTFIRI